MYLKRSSNYLDFDYIDDEEDEWEKEALSSANQASNIVTESKRTAQPNQYSKHVDILTNQYRVLTETEKQLAEQLAKLETDLKQIEREEALHKEKMTHVQQEYIGAIEKTVAYMDSSTKADENGQKTDNITEYIDNDCRLSAKLNQIIDQWKDILKSEPIQDRDGRKSLAYDFKKNEFDIMDLHAQIKGFEARIQFLNRDRARLNSLPQILPILKSETEKFTSDMKTATLQLEKLEKNTIRPNLNKLAELKVIWPLQEEHYMNELKLLENLLQDMDKIYSILIKQRACQQLVTYMYDLDQQGKINKCEKMESLVSKLEKEIKVTEDENDQKSVSTSIEKKDKMYLEMIDMFLDDFLKLYNWEKVTTELSLIEKIEILKSYETELKQRWKDDFQSCIDAAEELNKLQKKLSNVETNLETTMSKQYTSLQAQLEHRTQELTTELSKLEKDANDKYINNVWEEEKKLFSVFFTDPAGFEQLHSNRVNK
ncbi:MAG: hypothetical protein EXX96DRAFT_570852 [Benjaminiella poitrasii]|nr:MAG: hypothetical protein EXX96DRAFT_570852 [Benjaminiella poitrasii]